MNTVDIAMATYNGALYLEQQIESIRSQSFTNWRMFVRDDGSSDNTMQILHKYANLDSRIIIIEDSLGGLRVSKNFETALSYCTAPYTMLADQDDVWSNDKIERSLAYIKMVEEQDKPVLVYSNSMLTNTDLSIKLGENYLRNSVPSFTSFIFHNAGYQGAAMIFNAALRDKLFPFLERSKVHDYHISLVGLLEGNVFFLNESLMLYRRHETTTTISNRSLTQRFRALLRGSQMLNDPDMVDYLKRFISDRADSISASKRELVNVYLKIIDPTTSIFKKIALVRHNGFTLRNSQLYLIIKLIFTKTK